MPDQISENPKYSYDQDTFLDDISLENASRVIKQIVSSLGHIASGIETRLHNTSQLDRDKLTDIADQLATLATKALNLREAIANTIDLPAVAVSTPEVSKEASQSFSPATKHLAIGMLLGLIDNSHFISPTLKEPEITDQIVILPSGKEILIADLTETLIVPDELPADILLRSETSTMEFLSDSLINFDNTPIILGDDRRIRNLLNVFLLRQGHPSGPEEIKKLGFPSASNDKSTSTMISKKRRKLSNMLAAAAKRDVIIAVGASISTKYLFDRPIRVIDSRK